jgi:hypothetical protein
MLEVLLLPVVMSIRLLEEVVVRNRHMFCGLYFGFLVTIMNNDMSSPVHHFTELEGLLREGAGAVIVASHSMGNTEYMETKR